MNSIKSKTNLIPRFNIDYNTGDFLSALTHLRSKPDVSLMSNIFCDASIYFTNSGRTSLYIILKALGLSVNSKIGVPLYSCTSVFDAIIRAGHTPVFLDIDPDNYTLSPEHLSEKIDELDAVIAIHTFGRPADIEKIQKIAGHKPVIEDCAHALLSKYKAKITGTIATAGFFSFRTGKYISAGEGGMVVTKNPQFALDIYHEIEKLPEPSTANEIKNTITTYTRSTLYHSPWYGLVSLPLGSRIDDKVDLMNKYTFKAARIRNTDLHVIERKMQGFREKVEKQRRNSQYLIQELSDTGLKLPFEAEGTYCNYYLFPILFKNGSERDRVSEMLREKGMDTAKLFSKAPEIAKLHYSYTGDCPDTEKVAERILVVPNHYTLEQGELQRISGVIKTCSLVE